MFLTSPYIDQAIAQVSQSQTALLYGDECYPDVYANRLCVLKIRELPRALRTSTQQNDATLRLER